MLNDIQEIIMTSRKLGVSDIHISEGMEMRVRIDGNWKNNGIFIMEFGR